MPAEDTGTMRAEEKTTTSALFPKKAERGFHGYTIAAIAFYGPTDRLATKVAVCIILTENHEPDLLERRFSDGGLDVRHDPAIGEHVVAFLKTHTVRSTVVADGIIGCPHEEGVDNPEAKYCPQCPYWEGRDRWNKERIH